MIENTGVYVAPYNAAFFKKGAWRTPKGYHDHLKLVHIGKLKYHLTCHLYKVIYETPLESMPLYINDPNPAISTIARWRLKWSK